MKDLNYYIKCFQKLRVDRSHGPPAPHKPVLLISLCQAFRHGVYNNCFINLNLEILTLFRTNWSLLVTTNHNQEITYPFFHLRSEGFWKLVPWPQYANVLSSNMVIKSFNKLNEFMQYALIDEELRDLFLDEKSNLLLEQEILNFWFPITKEKIRFTASENREYINELETEILNDRGEEYSKKIKALMDEKCEEDIFLRGAIFKREIPKLYNYTCCISGMRIQAPGLSLIDACLIVPFSKSFSDTVSNGFALCPNLHRAFDRGLIAIDENYKVVVSQIFVENETNYSIKTFAGKGILLPKNNKYIPLKENFKWHRENIFK